MSQFKINDVAILQNCELVKNEGRECVVLGLLENRLTRNLITGVSENKYSYLVETMDGAMWHASQTQLRRKSPPASTADEREYEALMDRLMNRKEQPA